MRNGRMLSGILLLLLAGTASGNTSSILVLPATPQSQTPSIVERSEAAAAVEPAIAGEAASVDGAGDIFRVGPSVIAIGEDAVPAAAGEVASAGVKVGKKPAWMSQALPEVIRGGVRGGAFAQAAKPAEPSSKRIVTGPHTPEAKGMPVE